MAESTGASGTPPQTDKNRQDKPVFGAGVLLDCKAKLHFAAAKSITRNQEHFRCSNYKSGRGECTIHYIRDVALEKLALKAISDLAAFVRCYEPVFLYMLAKKNNAMRQKEYKQLQRAVENGIKRIAEIDRLIERIEVHNNDKYDGHCHVKVDIYYTAVAMIDIPTEKGIQAMIEEIQNNPQDFKFVA